MEHPATHSEAARQWVHVGSGLFALLLRVLTGWQAAGMAAAALVFNVVLLPRVGGRELYRPAGHARGFSLGIPLYPLAVLRLCPAVAAPLAAAVLAALVEPLPVRLDDNVSVPATAAAVLWMASLMTAESVAASRGTIAAALPWAIGVNALTGWLGYRARTVSRSGAIAGALVGTIIYIGGR